MKRLSSILFLSLQIFILSCVDSETVQYQSANPPFDAGLLRCGSDYLLVFRSENRSNNRFGGFMIFVDADPAVLRRDADFDEMSDAEKLAFLEGADYTLDGAVYNTGRDRQVPVLFSDDVSYSDGSTVATDGGESYTIKKRLEKDDIAAGSWLTIRAYLVENDEVIEVSPPGVSATGNNIILIEP